nr:hypothetical protein [Tanacetum cinerariifolium]
MFYLRLSWQIYLLLDHAVDFPEDESVHPKPAPIIPHHAPAQPVGYVSDDDMEEDEEEYLDEDMEEEPIEQVVPKPNNMDGFALHMNPQLERNMNGWLIEDDDEELEEDEVDNDDDEEIEMDEYDEDEGENDNEDDAEVINAYEDVDPLNRTPPTSDKETEFAPPVVLIVDVNDEPVPPVIHLGDIIHRLVIRLDRKMFDRYKTEKRITKRFREDEFLMNGYEYDITALDTAEKPPIHPASAPRADDPYSMVRDAAIAAQEDDDDDTTSPRDL